MLPCSPVPPPLPSSDRSPCSCPYLTGTPLAFRGVLHAPVNELGVILLFGMLTRELNIVVEHIAAAFPDCRALRPEPGTTGRWRRVALEFEYRSSHFKSHGHDAAKCDVVVCWDHDWKDCPIEVIELKDVVAKLTKGAA